VKIFIAGICGTFMAGIAQLAKELGHEVYGCDQNIYPPMSTLLESLDIAVIQGYSSELLDTHYDQIIIGNALTRGNAIVERILDEKLNYISGPQWLHDNVLLNKQVIAVAGTHGKTTTSSMIAWIMESAGFNPGFLIGGKPGNFDNSAKLSSSQWFIIEADEYDCAFFDKRSKFVHYCPNIAVINNLEFDHADIFDDLDQIKKHFHHFIRIIPSSGTLILNQDDKNISDVVNMGCWSEQTGFSAIDTLSNWYAKPSNEDYSSFSIHHNGTLRGEIYWELIGKHNMLNALASIAACHQAGVNIENSIQALKTFIPTKRRLQLLFSHENLYFYEDFAHHPTAIEVTLEALKAKHKDMKITALIEPGSNTMRGNFHLDRLMTSFKIADRTIIYQSGELQWHSDILHSIPALEFFTSREELISNILSDDLKDQVIICMSNSGFDSIPETMRELLQARFVQ